MKIAINALHIKWGVNGGTETYLTNIILPWYEDESSSHEFLLICSSQPPWWRGDKHNFSIKILPRAANLLFRFIYEQIYFPVFLPTRVECLFSPGYIASVLLRMRQVVTVHDCFAWVFPSEIGYMRSIYWRGFIPLSIRCASRVIAVSKHTADDLHKYCGVPYSRVNVILEGGDHLLSQAVSEADLIDNDFLRANGLKTGRYFLCVGFFKKIKNPYNILAAFIEFKKNTLAGDIKLALVGDVEGLGYEFSAYIKSIPDIICLNRISDLNLISLYKNSLGLVFCSLYEGFGLPILEAQSLGLPVVVSNNSAMPEIAGEGALIVNESDYSEIADAMFKILSEDNTLLIEHGYLNVKKYSWARASSCTLSLLTEK
jgi:glycosyltransferase involved in cell wall biosynthesis